jgi:bifunctional non-homologous end joining protein LigD
MTDTTFRYKPMLASPLSKGTIVNWKDWVLEEKFDGHRLLIEVARDGQVTAYTRPRRRAGVSSKTMATRALPRHLELALGALTPGVYDGECIGGTTSTDVTRLDLQKNLRFAAFDVLEMRGQSLTGQPWFERHVLLREAIADLGVSQGPVFAVLSIGLERERDVTAFTERIWREGGEGAILKYRHALYHSGKRSPEWLKVKKLQTAVLTVIGFEASRGEIQNRGPFAMVLLEDADGLQTSVKTVNDAELAKFEREAKTVKPGAPHPAIGRSLRIEYQDRTRTEGYRSPRWDRWEEE